MGPLRSLAASLVAACLMAACGDADGDRIAERPPTNDTATLLPTVAPRDEVVGPAPSSTVPVRVDPLSCTEEPVTIAERTLVARRQDAPSPGCASLYPDQLPGEVCWNACTDGTTFVDFVLDPELAVAAAPGGEAHVRYVAVYRTPDRLERRAEVLVLTRGDADAPSGSDGSVATAGSWSVSEVRPVDLSAQVAAAEDVARRYLEALASGDTLAAAQLLLAAGPGDDGPREDLARLVEDGLLVDVEAGPDELASALVGWCEQATCRAPDATRTEIAADHRVGVVATYETDLGPFDVVFDAGTSGGEHFVRGLPPVLP